MPNIIIVDGELPSVAFTYSVITAIGASSFNFTGASFGTARGNRTMIVAIGNNNQAPTAVTIGGVTAAQQVVQNNGANTYTSIWTAAVPTGTSGTVAVTWAGVVGGSCLGVWAAYALKSATATDTAGDISSPYNIPVNVSANGIAIGCAYSTAGIGGVGTASWSNATQSYDTQIVGPSSSGGSGASYVATTATTRAIAFGGYGGFVTTASASFR